MSGFITINAQNLKTDMEKVSYSLGVNIGENIKSQFPDIDLKNFELAIKDVLDDKKEPKISGTDAQKVRTAPDEVHGLERLCGPAVQAGLRKELSRRAGRGSYYVHSRSQRSLWR